MPWKHSEHSACPIVCRHSSAICQPPAFHCLLTAPSEGHGQRGDGETAVIQDIEDDASYKEVVQLEVEKAVRLDQLAETIE
jgi:hypothetical protein